MIAKIKKNYIAEKVDIGIKLAIEFKILIKDRQYRNIKVVQEILLLFKKNIKTTNKPLLVNKEIKD